jgi:Bacterial Ig-like domain (group 1)
MRKSAFLTALMASLLAACGSGEQAFTGGSGSGTASGVASVTLITSSTSILSDGSTTADISALVRDSNNQFKTGVPVIFSANNNGSVLVTQSTTDSNGLAKATLSSVGDPSIRTITVTALAGSVTSTVDVGVTGSTLAIQGPPGLTQGQAGSFTATLLNAGAKPVTGAVLTVSSSPSSTITPTSVTTNASGQATFTMNASSGGAYTLTVSGAGLSASQQVTVNADSFTITVPAASPVTEVPLGTPQTITVHWTSNGAPQAGKTVSFSSTRGTVSSPTATTDGSGNASVTVMANNAGGAVVAAIGGTSTAQVPLEFVATMPAAIDLQPSLFTISPGQTSTITAVVRDAAGNLVKNKVVSFSLTDVTGGTLKNAVATTDSQGRAQTVYTAGSVTSASQGVIVTASVTGAPSATVALTVAGRQVFLSIGTGNVITENVTGSQYQVPYVVTVTDANGVGVANVPVSLRVLSTIYYKGRRALAPPPGTGWTTSYTVPFPAGCADEDVNRNGVLDAGEDFNNSGFIEAGNIASVAPANAVTDANGFVNVTVYYPQEYAYYLTVALSASTTVQGTEYERTNTFLLPGLAADFSNPTNSPPGPVSPFGVSGTCADTL